MPVNFKIIGIISLIMIIISFIMSVIFMILYFKATGKTATIYMGIGVGSMVLLTCFAALAIYCSEKSISLPK